MADRELTYGEKAVGLTFNPSNNPVVDDIKKTCAAAIDTLNDRREEVKKNATGDEQAGEKIALFTLAIRRLQEGQMWGVKAETWKP